MQPANLPRAVTKPDFRLSVGSDLPFLKRVFASTRAEEMAQVDWTDEQKQRFLEMQFRAQDSYYRQHYPNPEFQIILHQGRPAGRLYVSRAPEEIRVIDISLLPEFRGLGLGTAILQDILVEARQKFSMVVIHVEHFNRAKRLYERLGFSAVSHEGIYFRMEWRPSPDLSLRKGKDSGTVSQKEPIL